jgi:hypothetical protein
MIEVGIILVETALLVSAGLVGANLLRKLEAAEEYVEELETSNESYEKLFLSLKQKANNNYSYIRQLDRIGSFEADDETGVIFKNLKDIVADLNGEFDASEEN